MSFRAVVMRDPTVLLCAFSDVIVGCRMRRFARGGEGAATGVGIRDIAQRMSGENDRKSRPALRRERVAGFFGGVIYAAADIRIRGKRLSAHGFAADARRHIFCRSA